MGNNLLYTHNESQIKSKMLTDTFPKKVDCTFDATTEVLVVVTCRMCEHQGGLQVAVGPSLTLRNKKFQEQLTKWMSCEI